MSRNKLISNIDLNLKVYLYNYYVQNGSFKGLSKVNSRVYRHLLELKKKIDSENPLNLTEWLEQGILYKLNLPKRSVEIVDLPLYNTLVNAVSLNIADETAQMKHFPIDMLTDFIDSWHLGQFEPAYLKFLQDRVPTYMGTLPEGSGLTLKVEGYKYWGPNLTEQCDFVDDILSFFQGFKTSRYTTPSVKNKIYRMLNVQGNLNLIGLDLMDLIYSLTKLARNSRANSIKELLELEGIDYTPIEYELGDKNIFLRRLTNYQAIIEGCEYEVVLNEDLYRQLSRAKLLQALEVKTIKTKFGQIPMVVINNNDYQDMPLITYVTRDVNTWFEDGNTLNYRKDNYKGA